MCLPLYHVEYWTLSGIHTGYRVVKGYGRQHSCAQAFSGDCYRPGSFAAAKVAADALCAALNGEKDDDRVGLCVGDRVAFGARKGVVRAFYTGEDEGDTYLLATVAFDDGGTAAVEPHDLENLTFL